nr:NADP-dependent oxidoreductase [Gordonia soli]
MVEAPQPHAGPGQIRISVEAAGINPHDWRSRRGQFERVRPLDLPAGVGQDAAGVVDEIGPGVHSVSIGDEVFGRGTSTYAEYAVLSSWAPKPDTLTFAQAAGYPSVSETALRVLDEIDVPPGGTLLVSGAAGGVGSAVVQIAIDRSIDVIGIAGAQNQEYLHALGARATTYGTGWVDRARALGPVDAALDLSGSGVLPGLLELVGDRHRVITIADLESAMLGIRFSGVGGDMTIALNTTVDLIRRGVLSIPISQTYPLSDAARAHEDSEAGHTRGRRVIDIRRETAPT